LQEFLFGSSVSIRRWTTGHRASPLLPESH